LSLAGCDGPDEQPRHEGARSVETIADEYLAAMLERFPETGTFFGIAGARHDGLTDNSLEALLAWQARQDAWLVELNAISEPGPIGSRDWVTAGVLRESLAGSIQSRVCRMELWSASTTTAWYTGLPQLFDIQPLESPELRAQALVRLGKLADHIDTETANLRKGLALGYSAPRVTVVDVPGEVRELLKRDNPFLGMAARADTPAFSAQVERIYDEQVAPAIERFASFIESDYLELARETLAVTANPGGEACYAALVRSYTTISPGADEIHELGLAQIRSIRRELQAIVDEHFGGGDTGEFLRRTNTAPEFTFNSADEILDYANEALLRARAAMPRALWRVPKGDVEIRRYPSYKASAVGEYQASSEDGSRPGIFFMPVTQPETRSVATVQAFLHHETWPGHHLQGALALENSGNVHPLLRYVGNSGFSEGWALYAERLAGELGLYTGPIDLVGLLSEQGTRASRLVVDTGLHTRGWTRQQAIDYMLRNSAWAEIDIQNDVDRYISYPGQAVSYMLGMLEILRLRTLAEETLGDAYDIRDFHARVLENGELTLPMLEEAIVTWLGQSGSEAR
jgi:uncharacterized protein (DUF885 family)